MAILLNTPIFLEYIIYCIIYNIFNVELQFRLELIVYSLYNNVKY